MSTPAYSAKLAQDGVAKFQENASILTPDEQKLGQLLIKIGQGHLFAHWGGPSEKVNEKHRFFEQIKRIEQQYPIEDYVRRAKKLLMESKEGANPYEDYEPEIPLGETVETSTATGRARFDALEKDGIEVQAGRTVFMLVAGGLGERLNYPGIKVGLPVEITTGMCYLEYYIRCILALQSRARAAANDSTLKIPLTIMTSGDTDARTRQLLDEHKNFGMDTDQLFIVMQDKVPAMCDNDAHFVLEPADPYQIITKPHGHGDVHFLLHRSGLVEKWKKEGRQWIVFFQDTNAMTFRAIPAALGVSAARKMAVNSLTVPRKPGEAVGAIMKLNKKTPSRAMAAPAQQTATDRKESKEEKKSEKKESLTINVEYNQLELLVKKEPLDKDGFSVYPGNINVLILAIPPYADNLTKTGGNIAEFINPKYADSTRTVFKKDARLECMMQDYPKLLQGTDAVVGFTQFERWLSFSAVKNSIADAQAKQKQNIALESASSGESDYHRYFRKVMADRSEMKIDVDGEQQIYAGLKTWVGARVVLTPCFGMSQAEIQHKFGRDVQISPRSTLILNGEGIEVKSLKLDGTLVVNAVKGAKVVIADLAVSNRGWQYVALRDNEQAEPKLKIRGYRLEKLEQLEMNYNSAGSFTLSDKTKPSVTTATAKL